MKPALDDWQPTLGTLHSYARIAGTIRRNLIPPLPHWWHASVAVTDQGLTTGDLGEGLELVIDLRRHCFVLYADDVEADKASLDEGLTATQLGETVVGWLRDRGVSADFEPERWSSDEPAPYEPQAAEDGHTAQRVCRDVFSGFAASMYPWEVSPVQLWPHHFDLAAAVFGTRKVEYEEDGETSSYPSQIGIGFAPADASIPAPYIYANPWPFTDELLDAELPARARWHTEGFQGAMLPWPDAESPDHIRSLLDAVYSAAAPLVLR